MDSAPSATAPAGSAQTDRTIDRPKPPQLRVYYPASNSFDFRENKRRAEAAIGAVLDATNAAKHTKLTQVPGDVVVKTIPFKPRNRSGNESQYETVMVTLTLNTEEAMDLFRQAFPVSSTRPAGTKFSVASAQALKYIWPAKRAIYQAYTVPGAEGRLSQADLADALKVHKAQLHSYDRLRSDGLRFVSDNDCLAIVSGKDIPKHVTVGGRTYKLHWIRPAEDQSQSPRTYAAAATGPASFAAIQAREAIQAVENTASLGRNQPQNDGRQLESEEGEIPQDVDRGVAANTPAGGSRAALTHTAAPDIAAAQNIVNSSTLAPAEGGDGEGNPVDTATGETAGVVVGAGDGVAEANGDGAAGGAGAGVASGAGDGIAGDRAGASIENHNAARHTDTHMADAQLHESGSEVASGRTLRSSTRQKAVATPKTFKSALSPMKSPMKPGKKAQKKLTFADEAAAAHPGPAGDMSRQHC